jgi:rhodanese-related sulfurtransferase
MADSSIVTPAQLRDLAGRAQVFDIRKNPDDRKIPGSIHMSGEALESGSDVPFGTDEEVVLYCGSGNSCARIARTLRERGYNAVALEGGYKGWKDAGFPTEER